uniref:Uncharacterized protein n=1 Tax=Loxodonta africana TaxID=9785 RepID=G3UNA1_LOXAF
PGGPLRSRVFFRTTVGGIGRQGLGGRQRPGHSPTTSPIHLLDPGLL